MGVLFGDDAKLPFADLDYSKFSLRLPEAMAGDLGYIDAALNQADKVELTKGVEAVRERFSLAGVQKEVWHRVRSAV